MFGRVRPSSCRDGEAAIRNTVEGFCEPNSLAGARSRTDGGGAAGPRSRSSTRDARPRRARLLGHLGRRPAPSNYLRLGQCGHVVEKGLALQASRLREDEFELQVPPDLVAGRLGGAHSLQRIAGRALASRLEWISGEGPEVFWGCPADASRSLAFSLCLAASGPSPWRCVWPPVASYGLRSRCPLCLLVICAAEREFRARACGAFLVRKEGWRRVENARIALSTRLFSCHRLREPSCHRV